MSNEGERTTLFSDFEPTRFDAWLEKAKASLKGAPYEKKVITKTAEGIDLQPMYWQSDVEELGHLDSLPGEPPFVRGSSSSGYTQTPWAICQELDTSTPEQLNANARADLSRGQTALGVILDGPTRCGLDVDQSTQEEIGRRGLSLSSFADLRVAFADIDLANTPLHIVAGSTALPLLSHFAVLAKTEDSGLSKLSDLKGCLGADPIGELLRSGGDAPLSLERAYDTMAASASFAGTHAPELRTVVVQGCPYHEAGASAIEELSAVLGTGTAYLRALTERGLSASQAANQIRFTFSLGTRFFIELAKVRAARLLWAQIVDAFGGDESAQKMEIHGRTSAWTQTVYDPYVNMLRNTTEALSGALGGVDSLHVRPFDEPVRKGADASEFSRRVSRNVQLLLIQESHATHPIDPAGGSWFIESLTDELARSAWDLFQEIEAAGGMVEALRSGKVQDRINATEEARAKKLATRKSARVGTNKYPNLLEKPLEVPTVDREALHRGRLDDLERHRTSTASAEAHTQKMEALSLLAGSEQRKTAALVEAAIAAVDAGGTLGDLHLALAGEQEKQEKQEQAPPLFAALLMSRSAVPYEELRKATEEHAKETESPVQVFLANIGPIPQHKARADFTAGFFEVGGFEILHNKGFPDAAKGAAAALDSGAPIVVICSTDAVYPEVVPALVKAVKEKRPEVVIVLAGRPAKEHEAAYEEAGLDHSIFLGCDCHGLLRTLQTKVGVTDEHA